MYPGPLFLQVRRELKFVLFERLSDLFLYCAIKISFFENDESASSRTVCCCSRRQPALCLLVVFSIRTTSKVKKSLKAVGAMTNLFLFGFGATD